MTPPELQPLAQPDVVQPERNADFAWDDFDSTAYFDHNYGTLRADDEQIMDIVADFFRAQKLNRWGGRAIDIGAGANLYPALTMLPFVSEVHLYERAFTNRKWLEGQLHKPFDSWWQFWSHINAGRREYQGIKDPFDLLQRRATVAKGNIFSLPTGTFDLGTMFFVAESITTRNDEFERAARSFVNSLTLRAPFAAAFMCGSAGYWVGNQRFPACSVSEADIKRALLPVAKDVKIQTVDSHDLREGYCGMIVATGHKGQ